MSKWYYTNERGERVSVTGAQLKGLATAGLITPETIVETEEGKSAPARRIKGLTFGELVPPKTEQPGESEIYDITSLPSPPIQPNPFVTEPPVQDNQFTAPAPIAENPFVTHMAEITQETLQEVAGTEKYRSLLKPVPIVVGIGALFVLVLIGIWFGGSRSSGGGEGNRTRSSGGTSWITVKWELEVSEVGIDIEMSNFDSDSALVLSSGLKSRTKESIQRKCDSMNGLISQADEPNRFDKYKELLADYRIALFLYIDSPDRETKREVNRAREKLKQARESIF